MNYYYTPQAKVTRDRYYKSEAGKASINRYRQSPKGKKARKRENNSSNAHARKRKYNTSTKGKKAQDRYMKTAKGKLNHIRNEHIRRARKAKVDGNYTPTEWKALCQLYDYKCLCCKKRKPLTADHIIPISKGGSNNIDNIQPLCSSCNSRKYTKVIDYRPHKKWWDQLKLF